MQPDREPVLGVGEADGRTMGESREPCTAATADMASLAGVSVGPRGSTALHEPTTPRDSRSPSEVRNLGEAGGPPHDGFTTIRLMAPRSRSLVLALISTGFAIAGGSMALAAERGLDRLGGLLGLAFFGLGAMLYWRRFLSSRAPITLNHQGIVLTDLWGYTHVPWSNVESIGVVAVSGFDQLGLRLRSVEEHVRGLSPERLRLVARFIPIAWVGLVGVAIVGIVRLSTLVWHSMEQPGALPWSRVGQLVVEGVGLFGVAGVMLAVLLILKRGAGSTSERLCRMLQLNRRRRGYEITLGWAELPGPAAEVTKRVEEYRSRLPAA